MSAPGDFAPLKEISLVIFGSFIDLFNLKLEFESYNKESRTILKGIDFSIYGKKSMLHEGDWKQGQRVVWKKAK